MMVFRLLQKAPVKGSSILRREFSQTGVIRQRWQFGALRARSTTKEEQEIRDLDSPDSIIGQVMSAEANFVRVKVLTSNLESTQSPVDFQTHIASNGAEMKDLLCVVRSMLKKMDCPVLVGDFVRVIAIDWPEKRGVVSEVLPRNSQLTDPPIANIDHVLVLVSIIQPKLDPLQTTRFLLEAESTGVPVTLALNKIDLVTRSEVVELDERLQQWGYIPRMISCDSGSGIDDITDTLKDRISVVIGPSGVGKSSLVNALRRKSEVVMQTVNEVSSIGRGKHTTRTISLLELPSGGFLADTPGFNLPDLSVISGQELPLLFPEVQKLTDSGLTCKFSNCRHITEPGCVIRTADWERYPMYVKLLNEIEARETYERQVLQMSKKTRQGKVKRKPRKGGRYREEVLLEAKTHRRMSRTKQQKELQDIVAEDDNEDDDERSRRLKSSTRVLNP